METIYAAIDQLYDDAPIITSDLIQNYDDAATIEAALVQLWTGIIEASLGQYYGDATRISAALVQHFGDAAFVHRSLVQRWASTIGVSAALVQQYDAMYQVESGLVQEWAITQGLVESGLVQEWDVNQFIQVVTALDQFYTMLKGPQDVQRPDFYVMVGGFILPDLHELTWKKSRSLAAWECTITMPDKTRWMQVAERAPVEIFFNGLIHEFFVEEKTSSRSVDADRNYQVDYVITGQSITASLEAPYALPITRDWPDTTMASVIVAELAAPIVVDWQIDDFPVTGNTFFVNEETPLTAIRNLVGTSTVMAVVQPSADGRLIVRRDYVHSPADWPDVTADHVIDDDGSLFAEAEDRDVMPGYNYVEISSVSEGAGGYSLVKEQVDDDTVEVHGFCVPWQDDFTLETSGGGWVWIEPFGVTTEEITEQVEFVDGAATAGKPVYSQVAVQWLQRNLGQISAAEGGSLVAAIADNSLAEITYTTKYRRWLVHDAQVEDVQVYIPGDD